MRAALRGEQLWSDGHVLRYPTPLVGPCRTEPTVAPVRVGLTASIGRSLRTNQDGRTGPVLPRLPSPSPGLSRTIFVVGEMRCARPVTLVLRQLRLKQQVGPAASGQLHGPPPTPAVDLPVIPGDEHIGHRPVTESRRAGVLRVLQQAATE